ncbi:hypothetical protein [Haladaptatus sp. NG-SE-30]
MHWELVFISIIVVVTILSVIYIAWPAGKFMLTDAGADPDPSLDANYNGTTTIDYVYNVEEFDLVINCTTDVEFLPTRSDAYDCRYQFVSVGTNQPKAFNNTTLSISRINETAPEVIWARWMRDIDEDTDDEIVSSNVVLASYLERTNNSSGNETYIAGEFTVRAPAKEGYHELLIAPDPRLSGTTWYELNRSTNTVRTYDPMKIAEIRYRRVVFPFQFLVVFGVVVAAGQLSVSLGERWHSKYSNRSRQDGKRAKQDEDRTKREEEQAKRYEE